MSDKVTKFLKKLTPKQRTVVTEVIEKILCDDTEGLDIKALTGNKDVFRVRKGAVRVLFYRSKTSVQILQISNRDDNTYKNL